MEDEAQKVRICMDCPTCYLFDVEYKPETLKLTSLELYETDDGGTWLKYEPPFDADGENAGLNALKKKAVGGQFQTPCAVGCDCKLNANWGEWSQWSIVEISAGFFIHVLNESGKSVRYRANGTVQGRSRSKTGLCERIEI